MSVEEKLLGYKRKIEKAKERRATFHGQRLELRKHLKSELKCDTIESGLERLASMRVRDTRDRKELSEMIDAWEEKYGDD